MIYLRLCWALFQTGNDIMGCEARRPGILVGGEDLGPLCPSGIVDGTCSHGTFCFEAKLFGRGLPLTLIRGCPVLSCPVLSVRLPIHLHLHLHLHGYSYSCSETLFIHGVLMPCCVCVCVCVCVYGMRYSIVVTHRHRLQPGI